MGYSKDGRPIYIKPKQPAPGLNNQLSIEDDQDYIIRNDQKIPRFGFSTRINNEDNPMALLGPNQRALEENEMNPLYNKR